MNVSTLLFLEAYIILELTCHKCGMCLVRNTDFKGIFPKLQNNFL